MIQRKKINAFQLVGAVRVPVSDVDVGPRTREGKRDPATSSEGMRNQLLVIFHKPEEE